MIREARPDDVTAVVAAYAWLFAPPGLRPPPWDPRRAAERLGRLIEAADRTWARERGATHLELDSGEARAGAHRFYERERPAYRSIQFGWEL